MTTLEKRVWIATYAAAFVQYATGFSHGGPPTESTLKVAGRVAAGIADQAIASLKLVAITSESLDVKPGAMPMTRLIGIAGRKRAGKDTVGGMIFDSAPSKFYVMAFAQKLKDICADVYDFSEAQLYGDLKEVPDPRYPRPDGTCLTPREAMEKCGTEFARSCYPDTWVDRGLRQARDITRSGNGPGFEPYDGVVITDVRFINEAKKIVDAGGEVWRVYRGSADAVLASHPAEQELNTPEFEALVKRRLYNAGGFDELRDQVLSHLKNR